MAMNEVIQTLQAAAESAADPEQAGASGGSGTAGQAEPEGRKPADDSRRVLRYSDEDVDRIIQKKLDRQRKQLEKDQAEQDQLTELEKREQALTIRERKADAREILAAEGIYPEFAELLKYSTDDEYEKTLGIVRGIMQKVKEQAEKLKAAGHTPKAGGGSRPDPIREAFARRS